MKFEDTIDVDGVTYHIARYPILVIAASLETDEHGGELIWTSYGCDGSDTLGGYCPKRYQSSHLVDVDRSTSKLRENLTLIPAPPGSYRSVIWCDEFLDMKDELEVDYLGIEVDLPERIRYHFGRLRERRSKKEGRK